LLLSLLFFAGLGYNMLLLPDILGRVSVFAFVFFVLWAKLRSEGVAG
jgi:hypothetical protein